LDVARLVVLATYLTDDDLIEFLVLGLSRSTPESVIDFWLGTRIMEIEESDRRKENVDVLWLFKTLVVVEPRVSLLLLHTYPRL
jgi:hypothetical protein